MIAIEFRFPAGRVHATGWDHHVNEGTVEWPPSPWRILRALVAAAHKLEEPPTDDELAGLLLPLTTLPIYEVPRWTEGHIRSYQPLADDRTTKVFDAFVLPERSEAGDPAPLVVRWPDAEAGPDQCVLLDRILSALGYLGRAESWVLARRTEQPPDDRRVALPLPDDDADSGSFVRLAAVVPPEDYRGWRAGFLVERKLPKGVIVPATWFEAITQDTTSIFRAGWSSPPGLRWVRYRLPRAAERRTRPARPRVGTSPTIARFALHGPPLPLFTDAVRVGDIVRAALLRLSHTEARGCSHPVFSGRAADGSRLSGHNHAYVLPCDDDGDGHVDHVVVCVREDSPLAFDAESCAALHGIQAFWEPRGRSGAGRGDGESEWPARLVTLGTHADLGGTAPGAISRCARSRVWQSVTPFVPPRHPKRRGAREIDGIDDQIRRELERRGLPSEPGDVEVVPTNEPAEGQAVPWRRFRLLRDRGGATPALVRGFGARLTFAEPVTGPIALGYAAHQGLGQFVPVVVSGGAAVPDGP